MSIKTILPILGITFFFARCTKSGEFTAVNASIVNKSCSRGCNQFLIYMDSVYYYPKNLESKYQIDDLKVLLSGTVLKSTKEVLKAGSGDLSEHDFDAKEMEIESISERQ